MIKASFLAFTLCCFFMTSVIGTCPVYAQEFRLPAPGTMVALSPQFHPPLLAGLKVHPDNPLRLDFILDQGDSILKQEQLKQQAGKLIKYFLASLTIPEKDLWVNLSPYEKNRIIPNVLGQTALGRDLLAEDYMLKQITASLIYPEGEVGQKFWKRIYEEAAQKFHTTNISVNTFNKVWIIPDKAVVYENAKAGTAYVIEAKLKVMLEEDYLSTYNHHRQPGDMFKSERRGTCPQARCQANPPLNLKAPQGNPQNASPSVKTILREIVLPELTKEVNQGQDFAQLRQVYNSLILASWYKRKIKDNILAQVYEDKNKVRGVEYRSSQNDVEQIYQRYLAAFKKGAYNYIKEEIDPLTQQSIPRKYFSGGFIANMGLLRTTPHLVYAKRPLMRVSANLVVFHANQAMSARPVPESLRGSHLLPTDVDIHLMHAVVGRATQDGHWAHGAGVNWGHGQGAFEEDLTVNGAEIQSNGVLAIHARRNILLKIILDQKIKMSYFSKFKLATLFMEADFEYLAFSRILPVFPALYRWIEAGVHPDMKVMLSKVAIGVGLATAGLMFNDRYYAPFGNRYYLKRMTTDTYGPYWVFLDRSFKAARGDNFLEFFWNYIQNIPQGIKHLPYYWIGLSGQHHLAYVFPDEDKDFFEQGIVQAYTSGKITAVQAQSALRRLVTFSEYLDSDQKIEEIMANKEPVSLAVRATDNAMISHPKARAGQLDAYPARVATPDTWQEVDQTYDPPEYTSPNVLAHEGVWADPDLPKIIRPQNPRGPTGLAGRGDLGRWGANAHVDAIVTRRNPKTGKLQVLAVLRKNAMQWALPGGFVEHGETVIQALQRELKVKTGTDFNMRIAERIYEGYADDPRNTDNAWVETEAYHMDIPYDLSRQLISISDPNAAAVMWLNIEDELRKDEFYASDGDFLRKVIEKIPASTKPGTPISVPNRKVQSSAFVVTNASLIDFYAPTYRGYSKNLRKNGPFAQFRRNPQLDEFEQEFFSDFFDAVKAYEQSGAWKYVNQHRKHFIEPKETLLEALEQNGFYESRSYFFDRLVRRYLRAKVISGSGNEEMAPISLNVLAPSGTPGRDTRDKASRLIKGIIQETYTRFSQGRLLLDQVPTNKWVRWGLYLLKNAGVESAKGAVRTSIYTIATVAGTLKIGFNLPWWMIAIITSFLGGIHFMIWENIVLPLADKFKKWAFRLEHDYYETRLQQRLLGRTPAERKTTEARFRRYFQDMREALYGVDQGFDQQGRTNKMVLDTVEKYILNGVRDYRQYIWMAELGKELIESGIPVDTRTVSIAMLKELADHDPVYFNKLVSRWKMEKSAVDILRAAHLKLNQRSFEVLWDMVPLIEIQQHEGALVKMAEDNADKILRAQAVDDDYGREAEIRHQYIKLRTIQRLEFYGIFTDGLLVAVRDLKSKSKSDRRAVILSYFLAGGGARLRLIAEDIDKGILINPSYSKAINEVAKFVWIKNLQQIQQAGEDVYGITPQEAGVMLERLNSKRVYSVAETFQREVLNSITGWVYDGMAAELEKIVVRKDVPEQRPEPEIVTADRWHYDIFRKVLEADSEYWEGFAGIVHEGFLKAMKDQANAEAENQEFYRRSLMVDVRLFDRDYERDQDRYVTDALIADLDERDPHVHLFLAHVQGNEHYAALSHDQLKLYHLKPVTEYLKGAISCDDMQQGVLAFYKIAKRLGREEDIRGLFRREIEVQFRLIERLKQAQGNPEQVTQIKEEMAVIADPLIVPWDYLMSKVSKFGDKAEERKSWLMSMQRSAVGVIGLLQNEHFFDGIKGGTPKLRKLLHYYYALLEMEEERGEPNGYAGHNFNWLAQQGGLLESSWFIIREIIHELGLDAEERFKDLLAAGDKAAQRQASGLGTDTLSNVIRSSDRASLAKPSKTGGIDLTSDKALAIQNNGEAIKLHIDPAMLKELENAPGFVPVIIGIEPLGDLKSFLGVM